MAETAPTMATASSIQKNVRFMSNSMADVVFAGIVHAFHDAVAHFHNPV